MTELPSGWVSKRLGDLAQVSMGQSPPGTSYNKHGQGTPFFQGKAEFGEKYPTVRQWTTAGTKFAEPGDILMSVRAPVGPTNIADTHCALGRGLAGIRAGASLDQSYLIWYLKHVEASIQARGKGTTFDAISGNDLRDTMVNLPPLDEQRRIVETLDDHLSRLDKALAEFSDARKNLILFERAILHEAFSSVASDYQMVEFKDFFNVVQPKFEGYKQNEYQMEGALPIIDQGSALIGGYVNEMPRRIDVQRPLLIFGDHTRCVKFVDFPFAIGADGTKVLEPTEAVDPRFAYWQLRATELRNRGYARHMGELRKVRFWLPETSTQSEIVQDVEQAFESSNQMRAQLEVQDTAVATMRRALLHSAFSGNLGGK
jgi:type I restriction enzyme S subunit